MGTRLAASEQVSDEDLSELATVIDAYQDVLNDVKIRLQTLGFSATTRMKTTGTLRDKLRRETARLSQVQDLAGARIVVADRAAQNEAVKRITSELEAAGCSCKSIDRREHPSHGYRAVHVVVQVAKVPVEIQVRTDLQDMWAQLVERLADRWGREIRYGGEPEGFDTAASGFPSRRAAIRMLMNLSDLGDRIEKYREQLHTWTKAMAQMAEGANLLERLGTGDGTSTIESIFPYDILAQTEEWTAGLAEDIAGVFAGWRQMTPAQYAEVVRETAARWGQLITKQEGDIRDLERGQRDILRKVAGAAGEG